MFKFPDWCYSKLPSNAKFWVLAWIVWFAVLWGASSIQGDSDGVPFIPHIDKIQHFCFFMAGGFLLANFLYLKIFPKWSWKRIILITLLAGASIGGIDEYHQTKTEGRSGNDPADWTADVCGTLSGAFYCFCMWGRLKKGEIRQLKFMTKLIINAHIISPDLEIENGSIVMRDGKILSVHEGSEPPPAADEIYDAAGNYAFPGFIDIHAHGADSKDVCDNEPESIRHIAKVKLNEGVTTWLPTTLTQPQEKLIEIAKNCAEYMKNQEFAKTPGLHVEGPFINVSKAGAQNPEYVREPNIQELMEIHHIAPVIVFSIAPCRHKACEVIQAAKSCGISSSAAHTEATYAEVMAAKNAGLTHLTHFGNAMTPLHHREIGMIGAGLLDHDLKLELICDGIHLAPDFLKLVFRMKPIEQIIMITDSMAGSWINNGECQLGGLDVIVENKVARLKEGGALAGSTLLYNEGLALVAELTSLPLTEIVKATSWNQAQSLGLEGVGKIAVGFCADIALLDKNFRCIQTFVDGVAML